MDPFTKDLLAIKKGEFGEVLALKLLRSSGRIVVPFNEWNHENGLSASAVPKAPGPDLCMLDEESPHFIEVKYRSNCYFDFDMIRRMRSQRDYWSQFGTFDVVSINSQRCDKLRVLDLSRVDFSNYMCGMTPLYRCMYTDLLKVWGIKREAYQEALKSIEENREWLE